MLVYLSVTSSEFQSTRFHDSTQLDPTELHWPTESLHCAWLSIVLSQLQCIHVASVQVWLTTVNVTVACAVTALTQQNIIHITLTEHYVLPQLDTEAALQVCRRMLLQAYCLSSFIVVSSVQPVVATILTTVEQAQRSHIHVHCINDLGPPFRRSAIPGYYCYNNPNPNPNPRIPGMADLRNGRPLPY